MITLILTFRESRFQYYTPLKVSLLQTISKDMHQVHEGWQQAERSGKEKKQPLKMASTIQG